MKRKLKKCWKRLSLDFSLLEISASVKYPYFEFSILRAYSRALFRINVHWFDHDRSMAVEVSILFVNFEYYG